MFGGLGELAKLVVLMNDEGRKLMIEAAKDITGREKFRKPESSMTPAQFDRSVEQVLAMVERVN